MSHMAQGIRETGIIRLVASLVAAISVFSAAGAQSAAQVPDLSGGWARSTFGFELPESGPGPLRNMSRRPDGSADTQRVMGDYTNPILKPEAAEAIKRNNEIARRGEDYPTPSNQCWPMVSPYVLRVQGMQLLQKKDEVVILYMQDHQFRHVRLNGSHPKDPTPTWYGDSVGWYDGDTLVVDTIGVKVGGPVPMVDIYGTPFSNALHVVEHYRLIDYEAAKAAQDRIVKEYGPPVTEQAASIDLNYKGKGLQVQFTVEDQNIFTMPWSGLATYRRASNDWVENVCAENTHEYYSGTETKVPEAAKPDF